MDPIRRNMEGTPRADSPGSAADSFLPPRASAAVNRSITIRPIDRGRPSELDTVARNTLNSHFESVPESRGRTDIPNMTFESMRATLAAGLRQPDRYCVVAVDDGKVVGHRSCRMKTDAQGARYGSVFNLFVDPAYRKQGIARRLIQDSDDWFRQHDAAYIETGTHAANEKMKRLYVKEGYLFERNDRNPESGHPLYIVRKYF